MASARVDVKAAVADRGYNGGAISVGAAQQPDRLLPREPYWSLRMPEDVESSRWFAENVQPHVATLRAWLRSRYSAVDDIDDVVQEACIRTWQAHTRGDVTAPKAFLFATARNLVLDRIRHAQVARTEPLVESDAPHVMEEGDAIPEVVARNQELALLTEAIQSLPDRCRQVFTLRKVYGLSQREIAQRLGISECTVSAQLTIGVQKCMDHMARCRRERGGRWP